MLNSFSSRVLYLRTSSRAAHPLKGRHVDLAHNCKMENQGYRAWSRTTGFFFFMTMFKMVSLFQGYAGLFPARVILFLSLQERKLDSRM